MNDLSETDLAPGFAVPSAKLTRAFLHDVLEPPPPFFRRSRDVI